VNKANDQKKPVAVIPVRAGSKRFPGKNTREFLGVPMLTRAIRLAQHSSLFEKIFVTTDDPHAIQLACDAGAQVPFVRNARLSDDFATTNAVIVDAIARLDFDKSPDAPLCCLYPTTPLLRAARLVEGYELWKDTQASYVFAALRHLAPVEEAFTIDESGQLRPARPDQPELMQSQLAEKFLYDAGQFYWASVKTWLEKETIFDAQARVIVLAKGEVLDINDEEDWRLAEEIAQLRGVSETKAT
jgi:pseudaminic acid cytidylyltransferase